MWQTKYASAVPKNLGLNFWPCSEGFFFSLRPWSVFLTIFSTRLTFRKTCRDYAMSSCKIIEEFFLGFQFK